MPGPALAVLDPLVPDPVMPGPEVPPTETAPEIPLEQLERDITELAAHIHAATCRWLLMLGEFIERGGWAVMGIQSPAHWLEWKCAVCPNAAREKVRVALCLRELPKVRGAFAEGRLSYSQVRAITRIAGPDDESDFVEIARYTTAGQLERVIRSYRGVRRNEGLEVTNSRHAERRCDWDYDEDGCMIIRAKLSPEDGVMFIAALEAAAESIPTEDVPPELGSRSQGTAQDVSAETPRRRRGPLRGGKRAADALLAMAERSQCNIGVGRRGGDRTQVRLHVDLDALTSGEDERCDTDDGIGLAPETMRRLTCDCSFVPILEREGKPLDVGRKTRSIPTAIRRALEARDVTCRYPGCRNKHFLDGHHIQHWVRQGTTEIDNLLLLCWFHHRMVHEGGVRLRVEDGRFIFTAPDGKVIPEVTGMEPAWGPDLEARNEMEELHIDRDTCTGEWTGEPIDIVKTVGSILHPQSVHF
jgi:hypothetical protein